MPKTNDFDWDQICFETDPMQILSLSHNKREIDLPLTQAPINFSVLRSDGLSSYRWGVNTSKNGDAYVYCRDVRSAEKITFHASGKQHISITPGTAADAGMDNRFMNEWTEPEFEQEAIATFSLIFPPWGVGRRYEPEKLTKDELLIVGHKEKLVVVYFFIVNSTKKMQGRLSHIVLGELLLRPGKTLHIIAWKEPQNNLMDRIRSAIPHASLNFSKEELQEGDYTLNFHGYRGLNSAYMLNVPIHYTPPAEAS